MSVEADVAFRDDPDATKADQVDGAIGELSEFHATYGYYAQGVEIRTAILPAGWEERAEILERPDAYPGFARCLEPHDLVIAKLVAGRAKDLTSPWRCSPTTSSMPPSYGNGPPRSTDPESSSRRCSTASTDVHDSPPRTRADTR